MPGFSYEEVISALLAAVPEIKDRYDRSAAWQAEVEVGARPTHYEVVESMLQPLLKDELDMGRNPALLRRVFEFFEQLAGSSDLQVVNLLQVGIFENLVGYRDRLATAWKYMGPETKKIARKTARIFHREKNLPPE